MATSIRTFDIDHDIPELNLKKGDFIVTSFIDMYIGAGVYGLQGKGNLQYAFCIERTDGQIQIKELGSQSTSIVDVSDFRKIVKEKIFARIIVDGNASTISRAELYAKLIEG